jgi:hypothetical protein
VPLKSGERSKEIFRYWVEIRELASGTVRTLPLTGVRKICLKRGKKNELPTPDEDVLQLQDGAESWEAKDLDELRMRLREKYPNAAFERTLHFVRDREAEERRERALNGLMDIIVKAVVERLIEQETRAASARVEPHNSRT